MDKTGKSGKGNYARPTEIRSDADIEFTSYRTNNTTFRPGDVVKCLLKDKLWGTVLRCEHYGIYIGKHQQTNEPLCISKYKDGVKADSLLEDWHSPTKGDHKGSDSDAKKAIREYLRSESEACYHLLHSNCEDWVQKVLEIEVPTQRATLVANTAVAGVGGTMVAAGVVTTSASAGLATATAVATTLAGAGGTLAAGTTTILTTGALTLTVTPTALGVGTALVSGSTVVATVAGTGVVGTTITGAGVTASVLAGTTTIAGATSGGVAVSATSAGVINIVTKPLLALGPIGWTISGVVLVGTIGYAIYAKKKKL